MPRLSSDQIYQLARSVGFPTDTAVTMTAIALRESGGVTDAYNGVRKDDSYGLWQINMLGKLGPARRAQFGISQNNELFDPVTNARAAYAIWGGNDANLDIAWYIYRDPYNAAKYQSFLPQARAAAQRTEGYDGAAAPGAGPETPVFIAENGSESAGETPGESGSGQDPFASIDAPDGQTGKSGIADLPTAAVIGVAALVAVFLWSQG